MKRSLLALPLFLLAACGSGDPYRRADTWAPSGVNAENLAAMIADPRNLVLGQRGGRPDAQQAVGAVDRIWQDRPKPLLSATAPAGGGGAGGSN
jgi:hypothetical protein